MQRPTGVKKLTVLAGALILATGCSKGTTVRSGAPVDRPTGATEVVVQVTVSGGFVPRDAAVTTMPTATVLGDGTLITPAPVPAIYPGPAIAPLQSVTLDPSEVDGLVRKAGELGLLGGELAFGQPPVADAPFTEVTITANGKTHRHSANALGISDEMVGKQEAANRRALSAFVTAVSDLRPGQKAWSPTAVAVYNLGAYTPDPQLPQPPVVWPLAAAAAAAPCTVVDSADLAALAPALARATARTPWVVNGRQVGLAFRPIVPGQPGCGQ